jgi:hypothetical protein
MRDWGGVWGGVAYHSTHHISPSRCLLVLGKVETSDLQSVFQKAVLSKKRSDLEITNDLLCVCCVLSSLCTNVSEPQFPCVIIC